MEGAFEADTAVAEIAPGRFRTELDRGWWVARGPNGGYVAAIVLRALVAAVADPARAPRSLTLHYLSPPAEGEAEVEVRVERAGRSLTTTSARVLQGGRAVVLALAAFSADWPARRDHAALAPPTAGDPDSSEPLPGGALRPPVFERWQFRAPLGPPPFSGARDAVSGGWLRLDPPSVADALAVAAMTDAWYPALFSVMDGPNALPTVDLTIHFRERLPLAGAAPDDWYLARFSSGWSRGGFVEEDGEVWSRGGVLLAQSRQLALTL